MPSYLNPSQKKNVVVIGGGHGLAAILKGIKNIEEYNITAIVSVADDGGSSGVLSKKYRIPPVGDIRDVLVALAQSETLLSELMDFRFDGNDQDDFVGHSLGNLIIAALTQTTGNIMDAIVKLSDVLNVQGKIVPSSLELITLVAEMEDGTIVVGESNIPKFKNKIDHVKYFDEVSASYEAVSAINNADLIILGIGSLYTSVIPNLIIKDIRDAINASQAEKVYVCNVMTEPGETDGFSVSDHINAIEKHLQGTIDTVVVCEDEIPTNVMESYHQELASQVYFDEDKCQSHKIIKADLLKFDDFVVRHDSNKIEQLFRDFEKGIL